ncbi:hypothetical protein K443DRAFT_617589 [Laccaria amethystina LaAM-08-1]|uniref:F-box domain-containing protein n=1 Tax=Laccaria amethystina LaAM-08-1 TaxID=1095629 RepID=A0A0C9X550_9AGAR|nr:hypothetical protein K443DRAFT_617589 [Laccaria amethystina LaAM-08-1]
MIDALPPELWIQILRFACTDDGSTGRAVSLVCRSLHDIGKSVMLNSIAVVHPKQVIRFAAVLASLPPAHRVVRHLFIASPPDQTKKRAQSDVKDALKRLILQHERSLELPITGSHLKSLITFAESDVDNYNILVAFRCILTFAAPHLRTLHVYFTTFNRPYILLPVPLPRLTELVIYGAFYPFSPPGNPIIYPSLTRLHLAHYPIHPHDLIPIVLPGTPTLTQLHITQIVDTSRCVRAVRALIESIDGFTASAPKFKKLSLRIDVTKDISCTDYPNNGKKWVDDLRSCIGLDHRITLIEGGHPWVDLVSARQTWLSRITTVEEG